MKMHTIYRFHVYLASLILVLHLFMSLSQDNHSTHQGCLPPVFFSDIENAQGVPYHLTHYPNVQPLFTFGHIFPYGILYFCDSLLKPTRCLLIFPCVILIFNSLGTVMFCVTHPHNNIGRIKKKMENMDFLQERFGVIEGVLLFPGGKPDYKQQYQ